MDNFDIKRESKVLVFTDLDGTLLDDKYSFNKALPALEFLREKDIPLILCSSKTRREIESCRNRLNNNDPFISENGGGIYIPKSLKLDNIKKTLNLEEDGQYGIVRLGAAYKDLRAAINKLRSSGFDLKGFGDMSAKEVAELTGLEIDDAVLAKERQFDEPFIFKGDGTVLNSLKDEIKRMGFNYTVGELSHIMGDSNKGEAVKIVKGLYKEKYPDIISIGLGDSPNDIEMLQNVDHPVIVKKKDGSYNKKLTDSVKDCIKAEGIGPEGWNTEVLRLLETLLL